VIANPDTTARPPRLNPFAFPSDTDFRFVLLVVTVLGASLFMYSGVFFSIPITRDYWLTSHFQCLELRPEFTIDPTELLDPALAAAQAAYQRCRAPAERANAAWTIGGVLLLLTVASLLYWTFPARKIRRDQLVPLSNDAPEIVDYLVKLSHEAKLSRLPSFLWDPLNTTSGGLAFGRLGHYYINLTGGLVTQFHKDQPAFRAVVLHELAHLRNADVDKTYFAIAVWRAFLIAAWLPYLITLVGNEWGYVLSLFWRGIALAALVYLIRNAVLRTRELYADVRASVWDGPRGALSRVLESLPRPKRNNWHIALQMHPDPVTRRQVLEDPGRLFPMKFWDAFATGIAAAIALPNIIRLMTALRTGTTAPELELLTAVLFIAPLVVGVVGIGTWRTTFAALARGEPPRGAGRLGLGLGLGILLGLILSFDSAITLGPTEALPGMELLFSFAWGMLLLISLFFFVRWIAMGASVWLEVARSKASPRLFYIWGLIIAGAVLAIWLALLFYMWSLGTAVVLALALPLETLWSIVQHPLTLLLLISLWAFPLAAYFSLRNVTSAVESSWAFLTSPFQELMWRRQAPFRPGLALTIGFMGGLAFFGLLLLARIALRLSLPDSVRDTDEFRLVFFVIQVGVAALMQAGVAAIVAGWVQRLGALHGLFGAFVAGCVMTVGVITLNLLFGGTISPQLAWSIFSQVVNEGALLSLPVAWGIAALAGLIRHARKRSVSFPQEGIA
jgi:Zn-dependent protease with chaperone function